MNASEKGIICMAFTAFRGDYAKSTTQIMGRLAADHKVLYIDYQYTFKDVIDAIIGKRNLAWKRILGFQNRIEVLPTNVDTQISVLSLPPILPINWINNHKVYKVALKLNSKIIGRTIRKHINKLGLKNAPVVNAYNPFYGLFTTQLFNGQSITYYCYDEISGSPWAQKHGTSIEKSFLTKVDKVIVSSSALKESKGHYNSNIHLVENGVDFDMFHNEYRKSVLPENKKPIVGYIGSLDERIDYELLRYLALNRPQYQFRFIGRVVFPELIKPIEGIENIEILDPIPYNDLPKSLAQFDVGLIPFLKTKFTKNIYPLKINEYLSMAKSVVKTDFAYLPDFDELVWTGNSPEEFVMHLDKAVKKPSEDVIQKRIDLASQNSWNQRVKKFKEILEA